VYDKSGKKVIQSFDLDGVIFINGNIPGLRPTVHDIIITGRSFEEAEGTYWALKNVGIDNRVYFNRLLFDEKTRITSGQHKGRTLRTLISEGHNIVCHYDDDEIQIAEISKYVSIPIIHIKHELTEKENIRHDQEKDSNPV
jgi:hypothetical protein